MLDARVADAHAPRRAVGLRSDDAHVAAEVHKPVPDAVFRADRRGAIGGVFLADAAEIELHPRSGSRTWTSSHSTRSHADQCPRCVDLVRRRNQGRPTPEIPRVPQNTRRQVESARAQAMAAVGIAQQRGRFGVDRHGEAPAAAVDRAS